MTETERKIADLRDRVLVRMIEEAQEEAAKAEAKAAKWQEMVGRRNLKIDALKREIETLKAELRGVRLGRDLVLSLHDQDAAPAVVTEAREWTPGDPMILPGIKVARTIGDPPAAPPDRWHKRPEDPEEYAEWLETDLAEAEATRDLLRELAGLDDPTFWDPNKWPDHIKPLVAHVIRFDPPPAAPQSEEDQIW